MMVELPMDIEASFRARVTRAVMPIGSGPREYREFDWTVLVRLKLPLGFWSETR
jgi:hypothetical protein